MTATMKLIIGTASNVVRVPNQALKFHATASMYGWFGLPAPQAAPVRRLLAETDQGRKAAAPPVANEIVGRVRAMTERDADKIDDLFPSIVKPALQSEVWVYDENEPDENRRLRSIPVRTGYSDEEFSELVSGDLEVGMQVLTSVVPPVSAQPDLGGSIFMQPQRNRGGMTPVESQGPTRLAPPARGGGGRGRQ
jgi:hypothetical protein